MRAHIVETPAAACHAVRIEDSQVVGADDGLPSVPDHREESARPGTGVSKAEVNFDKRPAVITFDDAKTDVESLTRATEDAGYPSTLAGDTK